MDMRPLAFALWKPMLWITASSSSSSAATHTWQVGRMCSRKKSASISSV